MAARSVRTVATRRSRRVEIGAAATVLGVAAAVFAFAYDHGGYPLESRDLAGVLVWAALLFGVVVLSVSRGRRECWVDGLAIAIVAVVAVALVSRFFPSVFGSRAVLRLGSEAVTRLSFPIGYWNGLAVFAGLGIPLLLRAAL